jgi:enamine deaminase RidA (YjgF/YER057c/UK114 family)
VNANLGDLERDSSGAEARLRALGIQLPAAPQAAATYVTVKQCGYVLYLAGHGPVTATGERVVGKVGTDLTLEEGREAARLTGLHLLASLREMTGSLNRIGSIVKVLGLVNAAPGFVDLSAVIDGCSELFVDVFGSAGRHARSAVGVAELPFGIAVEIEAIAELSPNPR